MLVGIAKLATESELLQEKRRVEYRDLETRRYIGRVSGTRKLPFEWTVNPYRGCEFGCKYCYARYTHEFMELRDTEQFERQIYVKHFDRALFRRELGRIPKHESIAIGTATDPYQPAERKYEVTRRMLEVLLHESGRSIHIATKSDLVARDADLLADIAARNTVGVSLTITTADERLARILEPYAPRPALRFAAIRKLSEAGVYTGVLVCPVMPLINDSVASLSSVAEAAANAGAGFLHGHALFLRPCAQKAFFPMLEKHFPSLVRRYRERFERNYFLRGPWVESLAQRVSSVRERYGLTRRQIGALWPVEGQLGLFDDLAHIQDAVGRELPNDGLCARGPEDFQRRWAVFAEAEVQRR